jgi:predicted secreted protein
MPPLLSSSEMRFEALAAALAEQARGNAASLADLAARFGEARPAPLFATAADSAQPLPHALALIAEAAGRIEASRRMILEESAQIRMWASSAAEPLQSARLVAAIDAATQSFSQQTADFLSLSAAFSHELDRSGQGIAGQRHKAPGTRHTNARKRG